MKREYCLDIDGNVYTLGDLNMFLEMNWICKMESVRYLISFCISVMHNRTIIR